MNFIPAPPTGTMELIIVTVFFTACIGMLINYLGKEILESLLKIIFCPFKWIWEKTYCYFAPRFPSIGLKSYKNRNYSAPQK